MNDGKGEFVRFIFVILVITSLLGIVAWQQRHAAVVNSFAVLLRNEFPATKNTIFIEPLSNSEDDTVAYKYTIALWLKKHNQPVVIPSNGYKIVIDDF